MNTWKIIRSFFAPFIYLVVVPSLIHYLLEALAFRNPISTILGSLFMLGGAIIVAWANVIFISFAEGTMSKLDAPKKLAVLGPYRYVRNPISVGMVIILWGEAMLFGSLFIFAWAVLYFFLNALLVIYSEEPALNDKFGQAFEKYKAMVPRWVPLSKAVEYDPKA